MWILLAIAASRQPPVRALSELAANGPLPKQGCTIDSQDQEALVASGKGDEKGTPADGCSQLNHYNELFNL